MIRHCKNCNKSFEVRLGDGRFENQKYCSKKCKKLFRNKNQLTGRELTRERIRERDKHTCQTCGKKWKEGMRRFDVHHKDCVKDKTKQYDNYEKEKDNLITLCHKCHLNLPEHRDAMCKSHKTLINID